MTVSRSSLLGAVLHVSAATVASAAIAAKTTGTPWVECCLGAAAGCLVGYVWECRLQRVIWGTPPDWFQLLAFPIGGANGPFLVAMLEAIVR